MIALWMAYATVIGALLVVATLVVERTASGGGGQRRWISMLALMLSVAVPTWAAMEKKESSPAGETSRSGSTTSAAATVAFRSLPHRSRGFRAASQN